MRTTSTFLCAALFCLNHALHGQNTDLLVQRASGKYRALAGAGLALAAEVAAIELNPAGLAQLCGMKLAVAAHSPAYSYSFLRRNSNGTAFDLTWKESRVNLDHAGIAWSLSPRLGMGVSYSHKLNPFIDNNRRAITGSVLFHQTTSGGVYALSFAAGFKLNERLSVGASVSQNSGSITSKIRGDNHGRETHKWAELEHEFVGFDFQLGVNYSVGKLRLASRFSSPAKLRAKTHTRISENRDYAIYFPPYEQLDYNLPVIVAAGLAYSGSRRWSVALDFETQRFKSSPLQLNLYEVGGRPNWKDVNALRAGVELFPFARFNLPLRFGYAYLPQLYASNHSLGAQHSITSYVDTAQNRRHLLAAGTTLTHNKISWTLGAEHSFLKWHRTLEVENTVLDDYRETQLAFFSELEYHWR